MLLKNFLQKLVYFISARIDTDEKSLALNYGEVYIRENGAPPLLPALCGWSRPTSLLRLMAFWRAASRRGSMPPSLSGAANTYTSSSDTTTGSEYRLVHGINATILPATINEP